MSAMTVFGRFAATHTQMKMRFVVAGLVAGALGALSTASHATNTLECDRLDNILPKSAAAQFDHCQVRYDDGEARSESVYLVPGQHAAETAAYLSTKFRMPALVKDCCQWRTFNPDTGETSGKFIAGEQLYAIRMQSGKIKLGWDPVSDVERSGPFEILVSRLSSAAK